MGLPLGLPCEGGALLAMAAREGMAHEVAGTLLGVNPDESRGGLGPLLAHRDPAVKSRAEAAARGVEKGLGGAPQARLLWPGTPSGDPGRSGRVSLRSLGEFQASVDGQDVPWPSADVADLAAYLLVHRAQPVPRDRLLDDLWPSGERYLANLRLQAAIYRLREVLGPGYPAVDVHLDGQGIYRWEGAGCWIDAGEFQERVGGVRVLLESESPPTLSDRVVARLEEAVELYRGELLSGHRFEWCRTLRDALRAQLLWAARLLMDHYVALQGWQGVILHGLKSLRSDPLQEDVVRDLMVAYFRIGDRAAVLRHYREVKRLLARDRGVWPSEETRRLRERLLGSYGVWAPSGAPRATVRAVARVA